MVVLLGVDYRYFLGIFPLLSFLLCIVSLYRLKYKNIRTVSFLTDRTANILASKQENYHKTSQNRYPVVA